MVSLKAPVHPDDERELFHLRRNLMGWRVIEGLTQAQTAHRLGLSQYALNELEAGSNASNRLSRYQRWAAAFDQRIELELESLPDEDGTYWDYDSPMMCANDDPEVAAMWTMSQRDFQAHTWQRMWIVAALAALRKQLEISSEEMGKRLNVTGSAVWAREKHLGDPMIQGLMQYARALGLRLRLRLMDRPDWEQYRQSE